MARTVKVTKGAEDQAKAGSGEFKPLPAKVYNVTIFEAEETEIKNASSANNGTTGARMQFRISDGQQGANRRLFQSVYDVERWAPKPGKDEGAVNFLFFQFYKALGVEFPEEGAAELPDIEDLAGEALAVRLKIVPDTYQFDKAKKEGTLGDRTKKDFLTNEIAEFLPEQDLDDVAEPEAEDDDDEFDL